MGQKLKTKKTKGQLERRKENVESDFETVRPSRQKRREDGDHQKGGK